MEDNVIIEITRAGNKIYKAPIGLLKDKYWQSDLKDYPLGLLRRIRKMLLKSVPRLAEKFNPTTPSLRYFGYRIKKSKSLIDTSKRTYSEDKAYIYVRSEQLVIDLKTNPDFASEIRRAGFEVKLKSNFQGKAGWLTGWRIPQSTQNLKPVLKWLCKAFEGDL